MIKWMLFAALAAVLVTTSIHGGATTQVRCEITAYCQGKCCCGPKAQGITASGKPVSANGGHFVAADRKWPFGTQVIVPGYAGGKAVPVLDRGGAIRGNKLDLFFADDPGVPGSGHRKALQWGRRTVLVTIVSIPNKK